MDASASQKRILILGGGFGGVYTARRLEKLFRRRPDVEIVLVSRDKLLLMMPLRFVVFSGFELGYEALGEVDSRLETVADWKQPYREGVVYYLRDGRVRGVLLWNVWEQVDAARKLIAEPAPFRPESLKGRLPA